MNKRTQLRVAGYLSGACVFALAAAQPAAAQDNGPIALSDAEAETGGGNVIMVTANKREEDAQDVPIAITALNADELTATGVTGTEDLRAAVPALNVTTAVGGFGLPRIRGVGATGQGPGIENPVAVYVDGVYYGASYGNLLSLEDAQQVAVLKGPQGTLFGRNATGGLIQITTRGPSFDFEASGKVGYGNYDTIETAAYVSGGLSETLAVSLSGQYMNRDNGFGVNVFTGNDVQTAESYTVRGKVLWEPGAETSVLLSGDIGGMEGANPAFKPFTLNTAGQNVPELIAALGGDPEYDIYADVDPFVDGRQWGGSLTVSHDFGGMTLKSITAYRRTKLQSYFDPDGRVFPALRINNNQSDKQFTQELDLISDSDGPFTWVLGAFYMWNEAGQLPYSETTGIFTFGDNGYSRDISRTGLDSIAGFAEGTFAIGPNTNITAGFRYTYDKRDLEAYSIDFNGNIPNAVPVQGPTETDSISFKKPTWRLSLDHRFSDQLMVYASYNRGFRSGTYIPQGDPIIVLEPETVDAFEVGLKSDLADGRVRINLAGYYYDQSSVQVMQIISGVQLVYQADGADIYGIDGDVSFAITDNLRIFGGFSYTDATYSSFPDAVISTPYPLPAGFTIPAGQSCLGTFGNPFTQVGGNCLLIGDASGNQLQNTPKFTSSAGLAWDIPTSVGTFSVGGNWYHNGGYVGSPDERVRQEAFDLLNASITWRSLSDTFYVQLWGRNLADEFYRSQIGASNSGDNGYAGPPRTYGVTVGFDF